MKTHAETQIGYAKIKLLEYDGGYYACDYDGPSLGMTLKMGDRATAQAEYDKVSALAPCQLHHYLTHRNAF
jgi:hypothetical protein